MSRSATIRCWALLILALGCFASNTAAKTIRIEAPSQPMTVRQARKALVESLRKLDSLQSIDQIRFKRTQLDFVAIYDFGPRIPSSGKPSPSRILFADYDQLTLVRRGSICWEVRAKGKTISFNGINGMYPRFSPHDPEAARMFAEAALVLRAAALAPDPEEKEFHAFTNEAKIWIAASPKPAMSAEARAYQLLAEDAFKRKDFEAALEAYSEALDRFPLWPEGQYNAALLAAETGDYEFAVHHMRRYLALVPDAPDAAAAKDKLLLWQLKVRE